MDFKTIQRNILWAAGNLILPFGFNLWCKTLKISAVNEECTKKLYENNKNFILAFWHGTMMASWFYHRDKSFAALVSTSKDGSLLQKVLHKWKYDVVRGSSNAGGTQALLKLVELGKAGKTIAITPDGPRGPAMIFKPGAVVTAKRSGIPVVMLGVGYKYKHTLKSWDSFEIPRLFSEVNLIFSDPVYIKQDCTYEDTGKIIEQCENKLNELQEKAAVFN